MGIRGRRGLFKLGPWDALVMKEVAFESVPGEQKRNVFPQWLSGKAFACNAGDADSTCVPHGHDLVIKQAEVEERAPRGRKGLFLGGNEETVLADSKEESIDSDKSINDRTMRELQNPQTSRRVTFREVWLQKSILKEPVQNLL